MISERDVNPRSAAQKRIRAALLTPHAEETPLPVAGRTQELDPGDILEVRDMAEVIARAEQIVAAPRSSHRPIDIFDALVKRPARVPTDDAIGPATPAPAPHAILSALPQAAHVPHVALPPAAAASLVLTVPVATEDDAYYAPGGRVRSLADVTLDGYRPEPTLLVRARVRRRNFTALAVAVLVPVLAIAAIAFFGHQEATAATSTTTLATATMPVAPKPAVTASVPAATAVTAVTAKTTSAAALPAAPKAAAKPRNPAVPTFDVNSLPTAKAK